MATSPLAPLIKLASKAPMPKSPPLKKVPFGPEPGPPAPVLVTPTAADAWVDAALSNPVGMTGYTMSSILNAARQAGLGNAPPEKALLQMQPYYSGAPILPPTPAAGGGGGGGVAPALAPSTTLPPLHDIKWKIADFDVPGGRKPDWWVNLVPKNLSDVERPDVSYLMMLNTLIPYLSPEDQQNAAAQLYTTAADAFSYYKPEKTGTDIPLDIDTIRRSAKTGLTAIDPAYFTSTERAKEVMKALSNMREAAVQGNRWKLGPGYTWLQNITGTLQKYGGVGGERQSRVQEQALLGALDPLLAQGQSGEIGPNAAIGRMLSTPFFSQDQLFKRRQTQTGQTFLGGISPYLFA